MNYIQLVQRTGQESGTLPDALMPFGVHEPGRPGLLSGWVRQAWLDIQNARSAWLWMRGEWQGAIAAGTAAYSADDFGLVRFAEWLHEDEHGRPVTSMYKASLGVADEGWLRMVSWAHLRRRFQVGVPQPDRPGQYAVDSGQRLVFGPEPDDAYVVRGMYRKAPQVLTADSDEPEMPGRFHYLIVRRALLYLATYDEAPNQMPVWQMEYAAGMSELQRDQLPRIEIGGGPLA